MDNQRLFLFMALAAVLFLIYESWMQDYGRPAQLPVTPAAQTSGTPGIPMPNAAEIPTVATTPTGVVPTLAADAVPTHETLIRVETDRLRLDISPRGATIANAWLVDYAIVPEHPDEKFQLLKPLPPNLFVVQSGLLGEKPDLLPTHEAVFTSANTHYILDAGSDQLEVVLDWTNNAGVRVKQIYTLTRGSYLIQSRQVVENGTADPLIARAYNQLQRTDWYDPNEPSFIHTFTGGVYYSPEEHYKKVDLEEIAKNKLDRTVTDGWIAMMQHYFLAAWIPPRGVAETFYTNALNNSRYIIGKYSPAVSIEPNSAHTFENQLFVGPKLQDTLEDIAPGLELAIDYGWLTVIAKPIFWLLGWIHAVVGNWGWSIIVLTILIKLAFYKLSETSYRSMAHMRQITPRLQALKDRYGDDKQRLNQAMMELYKTEKINPLGGCLPILIQIPVFIALYWVLLESVEMRHAPFVLWLNNLSAPDPYFILPLIMGVSMFVQQKLNPAPPDPLQAKIMMSLPFVFTVFFAFFPSGLVLYWTVNNLLSIAQQWKITRDLELETAKRRR
ncbi:YidC/Oxa1 family membrane protein insertase [Allochromatium warmingii]|uniref:Membrane protein insertase YidC n=1 Tax=Allochromatium warmingii TaxID=61595 RepID=A0A1H3BYA9_ALLWA|nr:membrane protein insertase YidC [Allochromatium warmingii]SDX46791.1 YidC/Oxa1 family membrane protein insertase [Allochromatium warmingii]